MSHCTFSTNAFRNVHEKAIIVSCAHDVETRGSENYNRLLFPRILSETRNKREQRSQTKMRNSIDVERDDVIDRSEVYRDARSQ